MLLAVYVPAGEDTFGIKPGSAIVGVPKGPEPILVDYEGGLYGQEGIEFFRQRLLHAADRHTRLYPTVARVLLPPAALHQVATYDTESGHLEVIHAEALDAWTSLWRPGR